MGNSKKSKSGCVPVGGGGGSTLDQDGLPHRRLHEPPDVQGLGDVVHHLRLHVGVGMGHRGVEVPPPLRGGGGVDTR